MKFILRVSQNLHIDKICIAHVRYHVIHKMQVKSNPIFGFPIPVFPIQYATFTELSLTIRGVRIHSHAK